MRSEIRPKPLLLGLAGRAASYLRAVRVERDDVPASDVEAVVALAAVSGRAARVPEAVVVIEVAGRSGRVVFVVPDPGVDDALDAAPGRVEHGLVLGERVVVVLIVTERQHA